MQAPVAGRENQERRRERRGHTRQRLPNLGKKVQLPFRIGGDGDDDRHNQRVPDKVDAPERVALLDAHRIKHRTVEADGLKIFYREAGCRTRRSCCCFHGFPSSSHSFRNVMGPLAEVARVIAPDMPGFGFTDAPDGYDYTFMNIGRTIDAFTEAVGVERFFLYIHDFGAPVPYHLALARPDRVLGLIIQNGNAHEEGLARAGTPPRRTGLTRRRRIAPRYPIGLTSKAPATNMSAACQSGYSRCSHPKIGALTGNA